MNKLLKILIAVAALSGTVGANVQAAELTVQKGDTLWDISKQHHTSVENIEKWNDLYSNIIHPGDVLTIAAEKQYTVQQDETLSDVANKFHVSVNQIKEWNKLNTDLIHPGLQLTIYEETEENVKKQSQDRKQTKELTVNATAYTASCEGCSGTTATGIDLKANPDQKVVAVDPSVIPLGSKVYVEGYGEATAADTGGAIKGNRIDIFIPSEQDAIKWGRKQVNVKILN